METSSKGNEESRDRKVAEKPATGEVVDPTVQPGDPAGQLRRIDDVATSFGLPIEPTQAEIEAGAAEALIFYEEYAGRKTSDGPMDKEAERILFALHQERQGWTEAMETDARATLQLLYPDVGGSKRHGPL